MGYMGLDTFGESDNAFDLAHTVMDSMSKSLRKGLKEKGNEYNTNGPINVALFFETFILPAVEEYRASEELESLAKDTKNLLIKFRDKSSSINWAGDEDNKKEHINAYNRMIKSLDKFLKF